MHQRAEGRGSIPFALVSQRAPYYLCTGLGFSSHSGRPRLSKHSRIRWSVSYSVSPRFPGLFYISLASHIMLLDNELQLEARYDTKNRHPPSRITESQYQIARTTNSKSKVSDGAATLAPKCPLSDCLTSRHEENKGPRLGTRGKLEAITGKIRQNSQFSVSVFTSRDSRYPLSARPAPCTETPTAPPPRHR